MKYTITLISILNFLALFGQTNKVEIGLPLYHKEQITHLDISDDQRLILTCSRDNTLKVWDVKSAVCITTFAKHHKKINKAIFFYHKELEKELIATASDDKLCYVIDPFDGKVISQFDLHDKKVVDIAFNKKKQLLISKSLTTTWIWEPIKAKKKKDYFSRYNDRTILYTHSSLNEFIEFTGNGRMDIFDKKLNTLMLSDYVSFPNQLTSRYMENYFLGKLKYDPDSKLFLAMVNNTGWTVFDPFKEHFSFGWVDQPLSTEIPSSSNQMIDANIKNNQKVISITKKGLFSTEIRSNKSTLIKDFGDNIITNGAINNDLKSVFTVFKEDLLKSKYITVLFDHETNSVIDTLLIRSWSPSSIDFKENNNLVMINNHNGVLVFDIRNNEFLFDEKLVKENFLVSNSSFSIYNSYTPFVVDLPRINGWDLSTLTYTQDAVFSEANDLWGNIDYENLNQLDLDINSSITPPRKYNIDSTFYTEYSHFEQAIDIYHRNTLKRKSGIAFGIKSDDPFNYFEEDFLIKIEGFNTNHFLNSNTLLYVGIDKHLNLLQIKKVKSRRNAKNGFLTNSNFTIGRQKAYKGHQDFVSSVSLSSDTLLAATTSFDNNVIIWDLKSMKIKHLLSGHQNNSNLSSFFDQDSRLLSFGRDLLINIWDVKSGELIVKMFSRDDDHVIVTGDNYYFGNPSFLRNAIFKINREIYPFEQFDLKYNRPDIILDRLGYADSSLIAAYHSAYKKRLKKMGFTEDMLEDDFHLPEIKIENFEENANDTG